MNNETPAECAAERILTKFGIPLDAHSVKSDVRKIINEGFAVEREAREKREKQYRMVLSQAGNVFFNWAQKQDKFTPEEIELMDTLRQEIDDALTPSTGEPSPRIFAVQTTNGEYVRNDGSGALYWSEHPQLFTKEEAEKIASTWPVNTQGAALTPPTGDPSDGVSKEKL